jgi:uncharacterized protein (DUF302 family)
MSYTFGVVLNGDIASVRPRVEAALAAEGFGILTEIDIAATFKAKINVDRDPYVILGACKPALANRAITADPNAGALLPCNVVLRQEGATVAVEFMDPLAVMSLVEQEGVAEVANDARASLDAVVGALAAQ